jgi:AraC family transcriptional regulator
MIEGASEATRREYAARMNRVVDHIQAHLTDPLDLEQLAAVACFSPFHFHRLFHGWMGETLQAHVHRLRLERAAKLLSFDHSKTITEIALDCGFSSSSTFARAFKQAYGLSASEWRKRKICQTKRKAWEARNEALP